MSTLTASAVTKCHGRGMDCIECSSAVGVSRKASFSTRTPHGPGHSSACSKGRSNSSGSEHRKSMWAVSPVPVSDPRRSTSSSTRVLPRYPRLQLIIILIGATDVLRWLEDGAPRAPVSTRTEDVFRCHPEGPFGWKPRDLAVTELLLRARRRWLRPIQVHERAGKWIGQARAMRARAKISSTDDARSGPDARPLRVLLPQASREGNGACRSSARGPPALVRQGLLAGGGRPHVARRDGTGVARGSHDLLFLRRGLEAHGPGGRESCRRGEGARRRAARPDAVARSQSGHVLRLLPFHARGSQGRRDSNFGRGPAAAASLARPATAAEDAMAGNEQRQRVALRAS